jgi:hypothetical protein
MAGAGTAGTGIGAGAAACVAAGAGAAAVVPGGFTALVVAHAAAHNALARTIAIEAIAAAGERGACEDCIGGRGG